MVEIFESLLICSIIMGVLTLLYRLFLKKFGDKYKAIWRYRLWFVIIIGFLCFLRPRIILPEVDTSVVGSNPVDINNVDKWGNYHYITLPGKVVINKEFIEMALCGIWIFIAIGDMLHFILEHLRFRKTIKRIQKRVIPQQYKKIFYEEKKKNEVKNQKIQLSIVSCIDSPMLIGYLEPMILLPELDLSEEELHLIICHELIHYKRRDTWWKFLTLLVRCMHWFNPVVYRISDWMDTECESACDEAVLEQEGEEVRILYGNILLKMIRRRATCRTRLATSFQDKKSTVQARFMNILNERKGKSLLGGIVILIAMVVGSGTYTIHVQGNDKNSKNYPYEEFQEGTTVRYEEEAFIESTTESDYEYETEFNSAEYYYEEEFLEGTLYAEEELDREYEEENTSMWAEPIIP